MSAMKNVDLSRRSFVAGAALAAGAAGVAGAVPLARADEVTWDGTYDVIVCGGGGSGLTAAYSALEQGAEKVLVLEKGDACGGTTATAEGAVQASGTTWQKELGVNGVDDDSADKHYAFWMQDGEGLVDPDLVRVMADNAADNLQWMADSFGITYSKVFGCYPAAYTDPANMADRIHLITDAADATKTGGVVWTTNAEAAVREAGGEIMTGTAAAHLVMGDDGVAGVETADGKHYQATKGVVLAMSGIEHNEELAKKYNPQQYWDLKTQAVATAATDTGDGIVMGIEAGADIVDTAMSPLALGTSHMPTESLVAALQGTDYDTGLDLNQLNVVRAYFNKLREKYISNGQINQKSLGVDANTLLYQVPGGMFSNMLKQLKDAGKEDKLQDVLEEIPRVREDAGYPPLVTPTSQIVGTQAVFNVIMGERYKMVTKEFKGLVHGDYGKTPAPIKKEFSDFILKGEEPITCRFADTLEPEMDKLKAEAAKYAIQEEDVLTYAMFPQVAPKFFEKRNARLQGVDALHADYENKSHPV